MSGSVTCGNDLFGDPAPQQQKRCEVRDNGGGGSGGGGSSWVFCAAEGETCHLRGSGEVRFGADRQYATRRAFGSVRCDVDSFGDPIYGQTKHCEVRAGNFGGFGDSGPQDGGWARCADEGERCEVSGGHIQVRFGTRGRYVYRDVYGALKCDVGTFGRDPYPGERKQCESRR
jgi:hypothetical protein